MQSLSPTWPRLLPELVSVLPILWSYSYAELSHPQKKTTQKTHTGGTRLTKPQPTCQASHIGHLRRDSCPAVQPCSRAAPFPPIGSHSPRQAIEAALQLALLTVTPQPDQSPLHNTTKAVNRPTHNQITTTIYPLTHPLPYPLLASSRPFASFIFSNTNIHNRKHSCASSRRFLRSRPHLSVCGARARSLTRTRCSRGRPHPPLSPYRIPPRDVYMTTHILPSQRKQSTHTCSSMCKRVATSHIRHRQRPPDTNIIAALP